MHGQWTRSKLKVPHCVLVYTCMWISLSVDHEEWPVERTYNKHMDLLNKGKKCRGCIRPPALCFNCDQYPPDMLHLKKGIISKLVNQLVDWCLIQGNESALLSEMKRHRIPFV